MCFVVGLVKQEVFGFYVAMTDIVLVQIDEGVKGLLHYHGRLGLGQPLCLRNVKEELAALADSTKSNIFALTQ